MEPLVIDCAAFCHSDILGQRAQAQPLRTLLETHIAQNQPVICDFRGVEVLTSAFMDECFGKLWDHVPHDTLRTLIRVRHLNANNHAVWQFVLGHR